VNDDGKICHQVLSTGWAPSVGFETVMSNISGMLRTPNADDALDCVKGQLYKESKDEYMKKARESVTINAKKSLEDLKQLYHLD